MRSSLEFRGPLLIWVVMAFITLSLLTAALIRGHYRSSSARWSSFLVGDPHEGATLFFEKKGCSCCHSVSGVVAGAAPDLGYSRSPQGGLGQIVSAMWNHGPRMS